MFRLSKILTLFLTLPCIHGALASELQPYEAVYKTKLNGFNVDVIRRLQIQDSRVTISFDAEKFLFGVYETSALLDEGDGLLLPVTFEHKAKGLSHKHDKELVFNWTDNTVLDLLKPERAPLAIENPTYDKLSYQTQLRLDLIRNPDTQHLEYTVTNGVRNRVYGFDRTGEEVLNTPLGDLRTIKFEREGGDDDRQVSVWVAPDWDFLLVQMDQIKEPGDKTERLILKNAKIAGKTVEGLQH